MPRKKKEEKVAKPKKEVSETSTKKTEKKPQEYFYGTGSRKQSSARVRLCLKKGDLLINEKPVDEYFPGPTARKVYEEPFRVVNRMDQFSGTIKVSGGGRQGQLGAVSHGVSRALVAFDETFRPVLSRRKLLTRDSRVKERRKYGHAGKARKMKQSPKR